MQYIGTDYPRGGVAQRHSGWGLRKPSFSAFEPQSVALSSSKEGSCSETAHLFLRGAICLWKDLGSRRPWIDRITNPLEGGEEGISWREKVLKCGKKQRWASEVYILAHLQRGVYTPELKFWSSGGVLAGLWKRDEASVAFFFQTAQIFAGVGGRKGEWDVPFFSSLIKLSWPLKGENKALMHRNILTALLWTLQLCWYSIPVCSFAYCLCTSVLSSACSIKSIMYGVLCSFQKHLPYWNLVVRHEVQRR